MGLPLDGECVFREWRRVILAGKSHPLTVNGNKIVSLLMEAESVSKIWLPNAFRGLGSRRADKTGAVLVHVASDGGYGDAPEFRFRSAVWLNCWLDHVFDLLQSATQVGQTAKSFPPYGIERIDKDACSIVPAVAGTRGNGALTRARTGFLAASGCRKPVHRGTRRRHRGSEHLDVGRKPTRGLMGEGR